MTAAHETKILDGLHYTSEHEWVKPEAGHRVRIGITDYAQDALTDVVYAELPDVGDEFKVGESMGVVESVKSVSDIFAPLSGKVVEVNAALEDAPEMLNKDCYGAGWFCVMETHDDPAKLLDAAAYRKVVASAH
ncbi:MAG: glycine cleavage system protein GcvH [Thermoplasmatota archaeon]